MQYNSAIPCVVYRRCSVDRACLPSRKLIERAAADSGAEQTVEKNTRAAGARPAGIRRREREESRLALAERGMPAAAEREAGHPGLPAERQPSLGIDVFSRERLLSRRSASAGVVGVSGYSLRVDLVACVTGPACMHSSLTLCTCVQSLSLTSTRRRVTLLETVVRLRQQRSKPCGHRQNQSRRLAGC